MPLQRSKAHEVITLSASSAKTATGGSVSTRLPGMVSAYAFTRDITATAGSAGDTLDLCVQTKLDGTNWTDIAHFAQATGDDNTSRHILKIVADLAQAEVDVAGSALAVSTVRHLLGDEYRAYWTINANTGSCSFTYSCIAEPM